MLAAILLLPSLLLFVSVGCGKKKNSSAQGPPPPPPPSALLKPAEKSKPTVEPSKAAEVPKSVEKKAPDVNEGVEKIASKANSVQLIEAKTKEETRTKEEADIKQEDSFEKLQPRKAEAGRAKEIKDEKVPNKGDYKTWAKYDTDDFDKSLTEEKDEAKKGSAATKKKDDFKK